MRRSISLDDTLNKIYHRSNFNNFDKFDKEIIKDFINIAYKNVTIHNVLNKKYKMFNSNLYQKISFSNYLYNIQICTSQSAICVSIALRAMYIYINRLQQNDNKIDNMFKLTKYNLHSFFAVSFLLCHKFYSDNVYTNKYIAEICGLTLKKLNKIEIYLLHYLNFNIFISFSLLNLNIIL